MASIGGVKGRGSAIETIGPDGNTVLSGRIRIHSDDYPRVADLFADRAVEYCGPIVRGDQRSVDRRSVILLRVDAPDQTTVSIYFEHALSWANHCHVVASDAAGRPS